MSLGQTVALESIAKKLDRLADEVEDHNLITMYGIMQKRNHGYGPIDAAFMIKSLREAKREIDERDKE